MSNTGRGTPRIYSLDTTGLADLRAFFLTYWRTDIDDYAPTTCERHRRGDPMSDATDPVENTSAPGRGDGDQDAVGVGQDVVPHSW